MNAHDYQTFTDTLQRTLERDPRVIGLMVAGSMASLSHRPDEWSDHDFWLIVEPDAQAWFHSHNEWLPDSDQIVLWFRESHGGFKAVYRNGHLLEFAVSDREMLRQAKVNDYRLLIDRDDLAADLARLHAETTAEFEQIAGDDLCLLGQFLTNLLVGVGRYRRGEQLSARLFIAGWSLYALLRLLPKHIPTEHPEALDNLDPLRRVEVAYPEIGTEINRLVRLDPDKAAIGLLDLANHLLRDRLADFPVEAVAVIRSRIKGEASIISP
jgi:lincosamide nucleotidyltransferase